MNIVVSNEPRIRDVKVTANAITAYLVDGRVISVPLAWSWRLSEATPAQREQFEIIGDGQGVHWSEIDEDISAEGMFYGVPAHRPRGTARFVNAPQGHGRKPPKKHIKPAREKRADQNSDRSSRG